MVRLEKSSVKSNGDLKMNGYKPRDKDKEMRTEREMLAKCTVSDPRSAYYAIDTPFDGKFYARSLKGARIIACHYIKMWAGDEDVGCAYITTKNKKTGKFGRYYSDIIYYDVDYRGYISQKYMVPLDQAYFNRVEICPKTGATLRKIPPKYKVVIPRIGSSEPSVLYYPTKDLARKRALNDMYNYAHIEKCASDGKYKVLEQLWRGDKGKYLIYSRGKTYTISPRTGKFLKKVE